MENIIVRYIGILVGITILTFLLSRILNVGTVNTWLSFVFVNASGLTITKGLWDISKYVREDHALAWFILVFCNVIIIIALILINIVAYMDIRGLLP